MKKISIVLIVCMVLGVIPFGVSAQDVTTSSITSDGILTYSNDFESQTVNGNYPDATEGIKLYTAGTTVAKFVIRGNNTQYLEMQNSTAGKYPFIRLNLKNTAAEPLINSIADAKSYKVKFRMRYIPTTKFKSMSMYLGGFWKFYTNNSTYSITCNNGNVAAVEGATVTYSYNSDTTNTTTNKFYNYEIDVDKVNNTSTFKIDGNTIFENVPQYTTTSFDELLLKYEAQTGNLAIDDIKVFIDGPSVCDDENYNEKSNITFDDFSVGNIPASTTENVGGFTNENIDYPEFYSYINYTYAPETPDVINKFLTITKNSTEKAMSVKKDISALVENCADYEISFKVKNDLETSASTAIIKDGDGSNANNGLAISFTKSGTASYYDYSQSSPQITVESVQFTPGEWVPVKFKVYKNTNKADIYISDMETPVATNITTKHQVGGRVLVSAPQRNATGSISMDDIVITPGTPDDYVFTYNAGDMDKSKYTDGSIDAQCVVGEGVDASPLVIIAEYDINGALTNLAISDTMDAETRKLSATLSGVTAEEGKSVKLMLWDNKTDIQPIKSSVTLLPQIAQ